ncbi:hypothetical protein ACVWZA_001827 [Sphingomonas sp. UYAg733]
MTEMYLGQQHEDKLLRLHNPLRADWWLFQDRQQNHPLGRRCNA